MRHTAPYMIRREQFSDPFTARPSSQSTSSAGTLQSAHNWHIGPEASLLSISSANTFQCMSHLQKAALCPVLGWLFSAATAGRCCMRYATAALGHPCSRLWGRRRLTAAACRGRVLQTPFSQHGCVLTDALSRHLQHLLLCIVPAKHGWEDPPLGV